MSATPEQIADERADWLLDAIAGATQDRQFLRGDAECNPVVCEAVLLNGAKAIRTAIARAQAEATAVGFSDACPCEQCANIRREQAREAIVAYLSAKSDAQAERVRMLEEALKPFADEAALWHDMWADDFHPVQDTSVGCSHCGESMEKPERARFTIGDLRRARAALKGEA